MAGNSTATQAVNKIKDAMPEDMHEDFETLKKDFGRLRDDVQTLMKDTAALGKHGGRQVADSARKQGEQLVASARDGANRAQECVMDHPLASIGIAVGVGLLAGMMLRR